MDEEGMEVDNEILVQVLSIQLGESVVRCAHLEAAVRQSQAELQHDRDAWLADREELELARTRLEYLEHPVEGVET